MFDFCAPVELLRSEFLSREMSSGLELGLLVERYSKKICFEAIAMSTNGASPVVLRSDFSNGLSG